MPSIGMKATLLTRLHQPVLSGLIHHKLVETAITLMDRFQAGSLAIGELFQFLAHDVVARHMLGADREFFPYLNR